jgi:hypothetical protein
MIFVAESNRKLVFQLRIPLYPVLSVLYTSFFYPFVTPAFSTRDILMVIYYTYMSLYGSASNIEVLRSRPTAREKWGEES